MSEMTPLLRHWTLLRLLGSRKRGYTLQELATEAAVSQKTIRRDLQALRQIGLPLEEITGDYGRKNWRISETAWQPPLTITLTEVASLSLAKRFLEPWVGTLFWDGTQSFFAKLRGLLSEPAQGYLDKLSLILHQTTPGLSSYGDKAEIIDTLMIAVEDRRLTSISYQSLKATEPVSYEIHPYGLVFHLGALYLIAFSVGHAEIRHFKVDRVDSAEALELRFPKPEDFNLTDHLAGSFGIFRGGQGEVRVKVKFSATARKYLEEKKWHASQILKPQRDGGVIAEYQLTGTDEIRGWILSFGRHAEVLDPAELRQKILDDLHTLILKYESESPQTTRSRS